MPFPKIPLEGQDESMFRIDDPWGIRRSVIPLFTIDRETHLIEGLGTAFRIDPFGTYMTAHHVFESKTKEIFDNLQLGTVFGLFSPGIPLGKPPLPKDSFVFVSHADTFRGKQISPLLHVEEKSINIFDCAKLFFDPKSEQVKTHKEFLPLRISGKRVKVGDKVMAVGYPGVMNVQHVEETNTVAFTEGLLGAMGTVTELYPTGRGQSRPWPSFEVSCKWPGGMSGSPIFNEDGHVIGIVSSSFYDSITKEIGTGYSFWFQGLEILRSWLTYVDPDNAGWIRGFGVFRSSPWHLAGMFGTLKEAEKFKETLEPDYEAKFGSNMYGTDNFTIHNG